MTTSVVISVPQTANYYVRVETASGPGHDKTVHYVDPGQSRTFNIWDNLWITEIREVSIRSDHHPGNPY